MRVFYSLFDSDSDSDSDSELDSTKELFFPV